MPRPAKPYLHRGWWVTNLGGNRQKLCPEGEGPSVVREAFDALRQERKNNGATSYRKLRVVELIALFLDTVKVEKSQPTYSDYQRWLTEFAKLHGNRLVREITRLDAQNFKNEIARRTYSLGNSAGKPYKPKTINHAIIALKRCWNWGIETELLPPINPIGKLPLLHAEGRQRIVTDDEFQALLRNNSDALFRQFLLMLRYTSSRPGEIRKLTWTMVDSRANCNDPRRCYHGLDVPGRH